MADKLTRLSVRWKADGNPLVASEIASQVRDLMRQMDAAPSRLHLSKLYEGFKAYAEQRRVCYAICEHVTDKFFLTMDRLPSSRSAQDYRDPTGEAA